MDDRQALGRTLWLATNTGYSNALDNYLRVKTEAQVRAKEEDSSPDFSQEAPQVSIGKPAPQIKVDRAAWEKRVADLSKIFREYPDVYQNIVMLNVQNETDYYASSEGSQVVSPHSEARLVILAVTRAEDGMDLFRAQTFEAETAEGLPNGCGARGRHPRTGQEPGGAAQGAHDGAVRWAGDPVGTRCGGVLPRSARPSAGRAAAARRGRGPDVHQGAEQGSAAPVSCPCADDPTVSKFGDTWLSGSYEYDDEGQKARRVELIQDGVLKTFLMSRLPIASFAASNGHGRGQVGRMPTGRQGNLIVTSTKSVPESELRKQLIEEAKKQGKPYGLYFEDISSGFAVTTRSSPQAFQVIPLVVYRVYVDGRPDELVRGVSIVGTPLAAMKRILATGDKSEVFNGECGAESGTVPVSAVAPAMLMSEMETQRQPQGTSRPPILPIPGAEKQGTGNRDQGSGNAAAQQEAQ